MLQLGDEVALYSVVFVLLLLGTRSPVCSTVLTASLYLFLTMFRFPQLPTSRARQVLHPAKGVVGSGNVSVVAHRCGGHDAPENTIVAIREVRRGREVWGLVCVCWSHIIIIFPSGYHVPFNHRSIIEYFNYLQ